VRAHAAQGGSAILRAVAESMKTTRLPRDDARRYLLGQLGLRQVQPKLGLAGGRALLKELRCIQLDPLDRIGTNADLVAMARVDELGHGQIYDALLPRHAFEHFAKERCLLPASAFPAYRVQAVETPWWRHSERMKRLSYDDGLLDDVRAEVAERGPLTTSELTHRGSVERMDWSGWKGTGRAATLALEVLWTRCEVVVCGRRGREKLYDIPERALPKHATKDGPEDFARWALIERVEAAGLLATAGGPWWSMLASARKSGLVDRLVEEGTLEAVVVEGSTRTYLAPAGFRARRFPEDDDRMRVLGPLDPLLWDRKLVKQVFDFDYVWEVYKPADKRVWGYYVCPLLHRGELVGRIEGRRNAKGRVEVEQRWAEAGRRVDAKALRAALARLSR